MRNFLKFLILVVAMVAPIGLEASDMKKEILDNNIVLVEKPREFTETISIAIVIKGGLFDETKDNNGIGNLATRVWVKSNKILESSEFYGAHVGAKISPYALEVGFSTPSRSADKLMKDFEEFLLAPKFDKKIFEVEKSLLIDELKAQQDNPNSVAYKAFNALVFDGTPYALPTEGDNKSISKLKISDVEKYYKDNFKGAEMVVAVAGNYDDKFIESLKKILSKIDKGSLKVLKCEDLPIAKDKRVEEKDNKIKQSKMYIGFSAPAVSSPEYPALKVLTEILGGSMSSRYFNEIRKNSGYSYSIGAGYPSRFCTSRFFISAGLDYANIEKAIEKINDINLNLKDTLTEEEIEKGKNSILGSALMETQSNGAVASNMAFFETMGLGADYYDKYVDTLKHIDKKSLIKAAEIFKGNKVIYILKPK